MDEEKFSGMRTKFDIHRDECHWLIQTKCDIPNLEFKHNINGISVNKSDIS